MSLRIMSKLLVGLSAFACASVFAVPLTVTVDGIQSFGELGNPANTVREVNVGANASITSFSYNLNLTAFSPSWLSQLALAASDSTVSNGVTAHPGMDDKTSGTATYMGSYDLTSVNANFNVGADGILRVEFYDDYSGNLNPGGQWNFGTLTFGVNEVSGAGANVPEPASGLLVGAGLALLGYTSRRRRVGSKRAGLAAHPAMAA